MLEHVQGQLPVATPELAAHGECEGGWHYVLMSQLPGEELAKAWPRIPGPDQDRLADPGSWTLSGLFDFEPAMIGGRAYEFVAVAIFVSRGNPRLLGRVMAGYGQVFPPRVLLAYTLLHVYSNLPRYLRRLPAPPEATLDSLAQAWFAAG